MDYFGVSKSNLPALRIVDLSTELMKKYAFEGSEITAATVGAFIKKHRMGKVDQVLRSEVVPQSQDEDVVKIVQKSFRKEVLESDNDVLVEFYAPWCGHCKELKPKYDSLAKSLKDVPTLTVGKVDAEANELPDVKIEGFPTIKLWPSGHKDAPVNFQGERTEEALLAFLKEHVTHKWFGDKRDEL
eukprot:TRINITY_DN45148_c0_g1_i4.p1 TRINITY_DN45148_c0_g1~~TRINITY_DN45148_c0_g1_i4.p1  ORF type:complete len:186 (-),score=63.63 TRINITY_DN45148_c0_g1_i4:63-620(-)